MNLTISTLIGQIFGLILIVGLAFILFRFLWKKSS